MYPPPPPPPPSPPLPPPLPPQTFSGYCTKDEISSICAVRNTMWMGTSSGTLKVFHAPTLKTTFAGRLIMADIENSIKSAILDILYVPETSSVLVANVKGEIWSFYDRIVPGGLKIQDRILLPDYSPCYHMAKVNVQGSIEVWGTMDDNRILLLEKTGDGWRKLEFLAKPQDPKLKLCSYIAHAHFTGRDGSPCNHIWISYRNRSVLVGWDANTRQQRCILNCADKLKTGQQVKNTKFATECEYVCGKGRYTQHIMCGKGLHTHLRLFIHCLCIHTHTLILQRMTASSKWPLS